EESSPPPLIQWQCSRSRGQDRSEGGETRVASGSAISPSPPSDGGEGRGEEARFYWFPLSSVLSPLVPRGGWRESMMQPWGKAPLALPCSRMPSELLCGGSAQRLLRRSCHPAISANTATIVVSTH